MSKKIILELTVPDDTYPPALCGAIQGFITSVIDVRHVKTIKESEPIDGEKK